MTDKVIETRIDPPPLRLVHLLLYMAVCSVFLFAATSQQFASPPRDLREASDWRYRRIIAMPRVMLDSANTTVLILLVVWTCRGRRVWNQPGHWLALWWFWQWFSPMCESWLMSIAEWLAGVETTEEFIQFWEWAKSIHMLRSLPFGMLFLVFACGGFGVANTCPWRIYFVGFATWVLTSATVEWLPFDWRDAVRASIPGPILPMLLLLAMLNDLRPTKPRRHWSH